MKFKQHVLYGILMPFFLAVACGGSSSSVGSTNGGTLSGSAGTGIVPPDGGSGTMGTSGTSSGSTGIAGYFGGEGGSSQNTGGTVGIAGFFGGEGGSSQNTGGTAGIAGFFGGEGGSSQNMGGTSGSGGTPAGQGGTSSGQGGTNSGGQGGASPGQGGAANCSALPPLQLTQIANVPSSSSPVYATHAPNDGQRLFLVEKTGRIRLVNNGNSSVFLDLSGQVFTSGEGGLLGLAFHPDYANNGRLFVFYNSSQNHTVVGEFHRSANDPNVAGSSEVRRLVDAPTPGGGWNHNGGMLVFGMDGALYISVGDGTDFNQPQNTQSIFGKVLRIDVANPPSQPLVSGSSVTPYLWERGLRNPWRMSMDRVTGDLYIGDVGLHTWEEINLDVGNQGNHNFEWPIYEGDVCPPPDAPQNVSCSQSGTGPIVQYPTATNTAIIGGYVYRGAAIPCLQGYYIFGSLSNDIRALRWTGTAVVDETSLSMDLQSKSQVGALVSFGEDANGEILVVDGTGHIFRIDPQ
jgi:glucose/arabinose dehydrogenase